MVVSYPGIGCSSCLVVRVCTADEISEWIVDVAGSQCACGVGGGHSVTVDVGQAVGVFGVAGLEWADGELHVTRKVYILFGNLPAGVTGVVWGVAITVGAILLILLTEEIHANFALFLCLGSLADYSEPYYLSIM